MSEAEDKALITEWIKDYCHRDWEELPAGIQLAVNKIYEYIIKTDMSKQSESLGDYSVTYAVATNWADFPPPIKKLLAPYRRRPHPAGLTRWPE